MWYEVSSHEQQGLLVMLLDEHSIEFVSSPDTRPYLAPHPNLRKSERWGISYDHRPNDASSTALTQLEYDWYTRQEEQAGRSVNSSNGVVWLIIWSIVFHRRLPSACSRLRMVNDDVPPSTPIKKRDAGDSPHTQSQKTRTQRKNDGMSRRVQLQRVHALKVHRQKPLKFVFR